MRPCLSCEHIACLRNLHRDDNHSEVNHIDDVNNKQLNMLQNSGLPVYSKSERNSLTVFLSMGESHNRENHSRSSGNEAANSRT